jgi:hypothetical protein
MHAIGGKTIADDDPPLRLLPRRIAVATFGGGASCACRHMSLR